MKRTSMITLIGALAVALPSGATAQSPGPSPLEATWVAPPATCELQNAALAKAGFTVEDLEAAGWDEATCGGMMHGTQITLQFTGDQLVVYQDGLVGWRPPRVLAGPTPPPGRRRSAAVWMSRSSSRRRT